tara:strand:- start:241 stop:939 length:699 start_codon:yes stop_codon:yes gene_type:complete
MLDERGGLSSASSVERDWLCRGAFEAQKGLVDKGSDDASRGTLRHDYEEKQTPLADIPDDEDRECSRRARASLEHLREELGIGTESEIRREDRFWLKHNNTPILSGQLDYLETWGRGALIADYKMLYGVHTSAPSNLQLAAYAALVYNSTQKHPIYAALIEPFGEPSMTTTMFDRAKLEEITDQLIELYEEVYSGSAPRTAGAKQCKFCKALGRCNEAFNYVKETYDEGRID